VNVATCRCSWLRGRKKWDTTMDPERVAKDSEGALKMRRGYTRYTTRFFLVCEVCQSRWTVTEDVDVKESETLYRWREEDWTDEDLDREMEEEDGSVQRLRQRQDAKAEEKRKRAEDLERTITQTGPHEWRWVDERGMAHSCRVEGPRLVVWTVRTPSVWVDDRSSEAEPEFGVPEFLAGRYPDLLPPAVAARVRAALGA
jgi:hypothetical protein